MPFRTHSLCTLFSVGVSFFPLLLFVMLIFIFQSNILSVDSSIFRGIHTYTHATWEKFVVSFETREHCIVPVVFLSRRMWSGWCDCRDIVTNKFVCMLFIQLFIRKTKLRSHSIRDNIHTQHTHTHHFAFSWCLFRFSVIIATVIVVFVVAAVDDVVVGPLYGWLTPMQCLPAQKWR